MLKKRTVLYILLALGILLSGSGVWLLFTSTQVKRHVTIPEEKPVIAEELDFIMRGQFDYLFIYEDGYVLVAEEKGLRMPTKENPPTRIWKTGQIQQDELNALLDYLKLSSLDNLDVYYQFSGKPLDPIPGVPEGGFTMGDMKFTISVDSGSLEKTVSAFGYLTPDKGETYPDMPYPLNDIYKKLKQIADSTKEIAREKI